MVDDSQAVGSRTVLGIHLLTGGMIAVQMFVKDFQDIQQGDARIRPGKFIRREEIISRGVLTADQATCFQPG